MGVVRGLTCRPASDSERAHHLDNSEILPRKQGPLRGILLKATKDLIAGALILQMAMGGKEVCSGKHREKETELGL